MKDNQNIDEKMTRRALELAALGKGQVSPGPLVGCVIVDKIGVIAGEGTYFYSEVIHAEVAALNQAGENARGGTAYISLEPHAHHGKTPPCTEALIRAGISRIVAPINDPNPLVSGTGFEALRAAGIDVSVGLLKKEAELLNEKFIHWHTSGRPFVHLKMASSLDGKIAAKNGESKWITGETARTRVQELRHEYDAVLIGRGTLDKDDPSLSDRSGQKRNRPLVRVVLDTLLSTCPDSRLVQTAKEQPTIIVCDGRAALEKKTVFIEMGVQLIEIEGGGHNLETLLQALREKDIQSILVEGGADVAGSFFDSGFVDKVSFFIAPKIIGGVDACSAVGGEGVTSMQDCFDLSRVETAFYGRDVEITGYPVKLDGKKDL